MWLARSLSMVNGLLVLTRELMDAQFIVSTILFSLLDALARPISASQMWALLHSTSPASSNPLYFDRCDLDDRLSDRDLLCLSRRLLSLQASSSHFPINENAAAAPAAPPAPRIPAIIIAYQRLMRGEPMSWFERSTEIREEERTRCGCGGRQGTRTTPTCTTLPCFVPPYCPPYPVKRPGVCVVPVVPVHHVEQQPQGVQAAQSQQIGGRTVVLSEAGHPKLFKRKFKISKWGQKKSWHQDQECNVCGVGQFTVGAAHNNLLNSFNPLNLLGAAIAA